MKIPFEHAILKYNEGLQFNPVSLFVDIGLNMDNEIHITDVYDTIKSFKCNSIIFCRQVKSHNLVWLVSRLIIDGCEVSLFIDDIVVPQNLIISNIIITGVYKDFKKLVSNGNLLSNDTAIIKSDSIEQINMTRKLFIDNKIESKLMFDSSIIDKDKIKFNDIHDIYPINLSNLFNGE